MASIFHPWGWIFQVSFDRSMVLKGRNFHYVKDKEVKTIAKCRPWCHSNLHQNAWGVRVQVEWGNHWTQKKMETPFDAMNQN